MHVCVCVCECVHVSVRTCVYMCDKIVICVIRW